MISSWQFAAAEGKAFADKDFNKEKVLPQEKERIYASLDQAVKTLQAKGSPFAPSGSIPGVQIVVALSRDRNSFRTFVQQSESALVVLGVSRGGDKEPIARPWRSEILSRSETFALGAAHLLAPAPLERRPKKSQTNGRRRNSRAVQKNQAISNLNTEVGRSGRTPVRRVDAKPPSSTPLADLIERTKLLEIYLRAEKTSAVQSSSTQDGIRKLIESTKANGRDPRQVLRAEQQRTQQQIKELAIANSPLPSDAKSEDHFRAGLRVLRAAEQPRQDQGLTG